MADDGTSRAGWHAQHLRHGEPVPGKPASSNTRGDRARLLREAMRALDESDVAKQAARNHSIVAADTRRNTAYVNDGEGGFRELTKADGIEPVLEYGDARIDAVKRKWNPKTFETTTIVSWVPKSLLKEVPDFYPVTNDAGVEVGRRSRWVMPDDEAGKAEVRRWFEETHRHLTTDVLRGGHDSIHGVVWNFDESQVHVHFMADTFAEVHRDMGVGADGQMLDADGEPIVRYKKPLTLDKVVAVSADGTLRDAPHIKATDIARLDERGRLRNADDELLRHPDGRPVRANADLKAEAQQMWGQSSETTVTREVDGEQREVAITGRTKMSAYQETYRQHLIDAGFAVELEANPERTSLKKDDFAGLDAQRREAAAAAVSLQLEAEALAAERAELDGRAAALDQREAGLDEREGNIDTEVAAKYKAHVAEHATWWKSDGAPKFRGQIEGKVRGEMADQVRGAQEQAREIVGGAQAKAEEIANGAEADAARIRADADAAVLDAVIAVEAVRDDVRGLDSDPAKARALYEKFPLRGRGPEKIRDAAKIIKRRLADEHAALDSYDPARADAAMTAAKLDTMRELKGPKRADGTARTVAEWVDEKTAERYEQARRPVPTETLGARAASLGAVVDGAADDVEHSAGAVAAQESAAKNEGFGVGD